MRPLVLTVLLVAGLVSCAKSLSPSTTSSGGGSVLFRGTIGGSESGTKTSYAGDNASDRGQAESIYWSAGDKVRIWCRECAEPSEETGGNDHFSDYDVTPSAGESTRNGVLVNPGNVGLRWGGQTTEHWFYAVYPSPGTTDKGNDIWTLAESPSGSESKPTGFTFTGHIPASQKIAAYSSGAKDGAPAVASPDMSSLYMVSRPVKAKASDSGAEVFLSFTPLATSIEFTVENGMTASDAMMQVESVSLVSGSHDICGAFTVDQSGTWSKPVSKKYPAYTYNNEYPRCSAPVDANGQGKTVTIDFTDTEAYKVGIAKGKSLRFTFFLLPLTMSADGSVDDVDDLYFVIKRKEGTGTKSLKTKLSKADGTPVPFPTHKKAYVNGILVPDSAAWTITYSLDITPWNDDHSEEMSFSYPDVQVVMTVTEWAEDEEDPGFQPE